MKENHNQPTDEAALRVENELKKLNLEMEYDAERARLFEFCI